MTDAPTFSHSREAISDGRYYQAGEGVSRAQAFLRDLAQLRADSGLLLWRAWSDTKARYRRSILGPYWITIGTLTFVLGFSVVNAFLFRRPIEDFLGYIAAGVVVWQFMALCLNEGSKVFVSKANEIVAVRTNMLSLPFGVILRGLIGFLHSAPIILVVVAFTNGLTWQALMAIPGMAILVLSLFPIVAALGTLAARFRDLEQLVTITMQFMFYMTPLLWKAADILDTPGKWIVLPNPFYYALTIVRAPLMGETVAPVVWAVAVGIMVICNLVGFAIYARFRQRIPFWI